VPCKEGVIRQIKKFFSKKVDTVIGSLEEISLSKVRYEPISKLYGDTLSTGCKYDQVVAKM
jgi:hypothetical protein